ncbi:MAG: hypothetical protein QOF05_1453 [Sphingomonadales bacterium]|nr:hypothetical protein [Sphingomonadales bacterium]
MSKAKSYRGALTTIAGTALSLFLSSQALAATTFTGTRNTGARTAIYSITTDDTIGAIGTSQITSWTMSISDGAATDSFSSVGGEMLFSGSSLWSTGTDLLFDYDAVGFIYASFYSPSHGSALVIQAGDGYHEDLIRLAGSWSGWEIGDETGLQSIASIPTGAVPEPGTWAMMIVGFGAIGFAMRRRSKRGTALQIA